MSEKALKVQETFKIGEMVTIKWATNDSQEFEYETGMIVGLFINSQNVLQYMVRIGTRTSDVPYYQVLKK